LGEVTYEPLSLSEICPTEAWGPKEFIEPPLWAKAAIGIANANKTKSKRNNLMCILLFCALICPGRSALSGHAVCYKLIKEDKT